MGKKKKTFGEILAVGAALGGAALGAAAVALSNKKNQAKIKKTVDEVSQDAVKFGKSLKQKAESFQKTKIVGKKTVAKKAVSKAPVKKSTTTKKK